MKPSYKLHLHGLTSEDLKNLDELLNRMRIAHLATIRPPATTPHIAPVSFAYDDGKFYFTTRRRSVKAKNLERNPTASLSIMDEKASILVQGDAKIIGKSESVHRHPIMAIFLRKYGRPRRVTKDTVLIEVKAEKICVRRIGR